MIRADRFPTPLVVTIALAPDGMITGLSGHPVESPADTDYFDYQDKIAYRFR